VGARGHVERSGEHPGIRRKEMESYNKDPQLSERFGGSVIMYLLRPLDRKLERILRQGEQIMSAVTEFAAKVNQNFADIKAGIAALDAQIVAFQQTPGVLPQNEQDMLDAIVKASGELAVAAKAVMPPVPPLV
jgi:hypothetical protein